MTSRVLFVVVVAVAALAGSSDAPLRTTTTVLMRVHAHNDYEHGRPLLDALAYGVCSVEADIYLVDGELLVGHDRDALRADRTLQSLYLDPLTERVGRNGGRVYPGGPACTLLIDVKSDAEPTYAALRGVLARYAPIFSVFGDERGASRALVAIVTGNAARVAIAADVPRYAAFDGTLADLDSTAPADLMPWISVEWRRLFTWRGDGPMPAAELGILHATVARAHLHGRKLRFWGAPDVPTSWTLLLGAGVDLINTDDLPRARPTAAGRGAVSANVVIAGEGSVIWLMRYASPKSAEFVCIQRVVGTLAARSGSFVMRTEGTFDGEVARWTATVLPDTGSGALRGLRGGGKFGGRLRATLSLIGARRLGPRAAMSTSG